eukprot:TRINITY_DN2108_c0_g1_i1.p1 TRINITY_DN2108_c0_g1~~TRINITY_DN2108_c0_g1_i1.p1  ORF type:complete len:546 (-),score=63.96 TRINITY_DN2108_c0_g1_i1:752-2389(-)
MAGGRGSSHKKQKKRLSNENQRQRQSSTEEQILAWVDEGTSLEPFSFSAPLSANHVFMEQDSSSPCEGPSPPTQAHNTSSCLSSVDVSASRAHPEEVPAILIPVSELAVEFTAISGERNSVSPEDDFSSLNLVLRQPPPVHNVAEGANPAPSMQHALLNVNPQSHGSSPPVSDGFLGVTGPEVPKPGAGKAIISESARKYSVDKGGRLPHVQEMHQESAAVIDEIALPTRKRFGKAAARKTTDVLGVELHCHSRCSDGGLTPRELVVRAAKLGVRIIALTDHDTMSGVDEAIREGLARGIRVIAGVEISAFTTMGTGTTVPSEAPVHILGYYSGGGPLLAAREELERQLASIREGRFHRAREMLKKLEALGAPVRWQRVSEIAGPGVAPGRVHVAKALLEAGHVASLKDAFDNLLRDHGPAYARGAELPAEEAVDLIRRTGGVAVLAHPWSLKGVALPRLLRRLSAAGLFGIEVFGDKRLKTGPDYVGLAKEHGLLPLGGSDFHGLPGKAREREVGSVAVPLPVLLILITELQRVWRQSLGPTSV